MRNNWGIVGIVAATVLVAIFLTWLTPSCAIADYRLPTTGPKLALYDIRPSQIYNQHLYFDQYEQREAAKYDMICSAYHWTEAETCKRNNPNVIVLQNLTFGGPWPIANMQEWEYPDTTWWIEKLTQYYVKKNLERGVDWRYKDSDGNLLPLIWAKEMCNFTTSCPRGVYGTSRNMSFSTWLRLRAFPAVLRDPKFANNYDGIIFDTYPTVDCWDSRWDGVDYNYDRVEDDNYGMRPYGCGDYLALNHQWSIQKVNNLQLLWNSLLYSKPDDFLLLYGQDGACCPAANRFNGWKIEGWYFQNGAAQHGSKWQCFWDGTNNTTGYFEAEQKFGLGYGEPDSLYGWDMTILHQELREYWSTEQKLQWTRFGLGTAMLGDGYYSVQIRLNDGGYRYFCPPEFSEWEVKLPAKSEMYKMKDPSYPGVDRFCRLYEDINGRICTVVVDTLKHDAYMFRYNYGPGRKPPKNTRWN